jgi:ferredoxin
MAVNALTLQSSDADIFAGGDSIRGTSTVIEAIADGKKAAISIDRYLTGEDLYAGRKTEWVAVENVQKEKYSPARRTAMPRLAPEKRLTGFAEVQLGLSAEQAQQEGQRCLGCGSACVQACPYGVIQFNGAEAKSHKCDLCFERVHAGEIPVCALTCLTDAIEFGEVEMLRQLAALKGTEVVDELSKESVLYVK